MQLALGFLQLSDGYKERFCRHIHQHFWENEAVLVIPGDFTQGKRDSFPALSARTFQWQHRIRQVCNTSTTHLCTVFDLKG